MGVLYARSGGAWVPVASGSVDQRWYSAWGQVASGGFNFSDGAPLVDSVSLVTPLSFASVAGRRYRLTLVVRALSGANGSGYVQFRSDGVAQTDRHVPVFASYLTNINLHWVFNGDGAAHTYDALWKCSLSITGYSSGGLFYIEDIGPVTGAALIPQVAVTAWTDLTLNANWTNLGGGNAPAQLRKVGDMVQVRGEIRAGAGAANPVTNLPAGFRPPYQMSFVAANRTSSTSVFQASVFTDGNINIYGVPGVVDIGLGTVQFSVTT